MAQHQARAGARAGARATDGRHRREDDAALGQTGLEELVAARLRVLFRSCGSDVLGGNVYEQVIQRVERPLIRLALEHTGGNQLRAAELLGLNRNTLRKKIAELGLYQLEDGPTTNGLGPRHPPRAARARRR